MKALKFCHKNEYFTTLNDNRSNFIRQKIHNFVCFYRLTRVIIFFLLCSSQKIIIKCLFRKSCLNLKKYPELSPIGTTKELQINHFMQEPDIKLVDSSEYHKDTSSEMKFKAFVKSWKFVILIIWCIGYKLMINLQFGSTYFIVSLILLIFMNLGQRQKGEMSAYSVFNKGNFRLPGTMTLGSFGLSEEEENSGGNQQNWEEPPLREFDPKYFSKNANNPCYCGSEQKYKKCCYLRQLRAQEEKEREEKQISYQESQIRQKYEQQD